MLDAQAVFCRLLSMIESFEDDETVMRPFCEGAAAVINGRKKADADASDIRLVTAAAAIAYCRYLTAKYAADGDIGSIRAGDITISGSGVNAVDTAERMMNAAIEDAYPLLLDTQFAFGVV